MHGTSSIIPPAKIIKSENKHHSSSSVVTLKYRQKAIKS
jgi:hypothetical protein